MRQCRRSLFSERGIDGRVFLEVLDGLRAAVFEDVEVFRLQPNDGFTFCIGDGDVLHDQLNAGVEGHNAVAIWQRLGIVVPPRSAVLLRIKRGG